MDDGKPTGPQAEWWSRPPAAPTGRTEPDGAAAAPAAAMEDVTGAAPTRHTPDTDDRNTGGPRPAAETAAPDRPAPGPAAPAPGAGEPGERGGDGGPVRPPGQPLHEPDEYSTPPYGGPGPWAPAPPVQLPTPPHGTAVPPHAAGPASRYGGTSGAGIPAQPPAPPAEPLVPPPARPAAYAQPPAPVPQGSHGQEPAPQHGQWLQYDPWGAPGQPLTRPGPPAGVEPERRKSRRSGAFAGVLLLTLVASGIGGGVGAYIERNGGLTTVELPQAGRDGGDRAPTSVAGIAASALPSVVTLHVSGTAESGTGTGFVLDEQGHILTNNHVVAPAGSSGDITVTFSTGETAAAELVGKDSGYDLAVVKVRGVSGLTPLPLGNSDNVQVGDPVVAIGAPFDLSNTVTSGIISAKQRPITAGGEKGDGSDISYVDALQTDAPINPGNSGGPLVDSRAHVIGINSAIRAADSGRGPEAGGQSGSIGLGFAIPINQGKRVAEELINTGRATHPVIGVTLDMQYTGDGAKVGAEGAEGGPAVAKDGPADAAGIRSGDVITAVEGQRVRSGEELIVKIRAHRPGDELDLLLTRGGKERTVTLTLGSASGT
ncbi:S1C family serine protease [Streptomyces pratensis]|uniref:S1C family serine protease n=1 Tax=Streptomyces pratensis TaxID=1169025 RepID=UPI00301AAF95